MDDNYHRQNSDDKSARQKFLKYLFISCLLVVSIYTLYPSTPMVIEVDSSYGDYVPETNPVSLLQNSNENPSDLVNLSSDLTAVVSLVDTTERCDTKLKCTNYRGTQSTTRSGKICKNWNLQKGTYAHSKWPSGLLTQNYCRNPDVRDEIKALDLQLAEAKKCKQQRRLNPSMKRCDLQVAIVDAKEKFQALVKESTDAGDTIWCYVESSNPNEDPWEYCDPIPAYDQQKTYPELKCKENNCSDYRGTLAENYDGTSCKPWNDYIGSIKNILNEEEISLAGLTENYCRNPFNQPDGPMCITSEPYQYSFSMTPCYKPKSEKNQETCDLVGKCKDYRGTKSTTKSGKTCKNWNLITQITFLKQYTSDYLAKNYCRNPFDTSDWNTMRDTIWCYLESPDLNNPEGDWEYCDQPLPELEEVAFD